ncbi:MAG: glycosyltransferase family 2 protein [Flavisolibacter sp.]
MQIEYRAEKYPSGVLPHAHAVATQSKRALTLTGKELEDPRVSAVIITYNEETLIGKTLAQLWWCHEIVVIDSGSTDRTVEICRDFGCSVYTHAFKGFGEQKSFGVSKAKNDWVLCIDADEVLSESLIDEIRTELSKKEINYTAFSIPRNLVFMNKVFKYGKETNSFVIRLFNKTKAGWDGALVHERVLADGPVKTLHHKILHYSYHDYSQFLGKINLYSSMGAQRLMERNARKSRLMVMLALPFNFFRYFIIDRNFLNGYRGFSWALLNTCYHFVKYLKLEELRRKGN